MKTSPQMTIVDPRIRIPAWRSASPKNCSTRPEQTSPIVRPQKRAISPGEGSQSLGTASQPGISSPQTRRKRTNPSKLGSPLACGSLGAFRRHWFSLDHVQFRMGGEERLGEDVVEGED